MATRRYVKPRAGYIVRDPSTGNIIPPGGAEVITTGNYGMLIQKSLDSGDLTEVTFGIAQSAASVALRPFGLGSHQNESHHYEKWIEAGVQWIRMDIPWDELEGTQGVYNWAPWDNAIGVANTLGLQVLLVLGYCPSWANGGNAHHWTPLVAFDPNYSAYVSAVTTRYASSVSAWEVWNEPDLDFFHHAHAGDWAYVNFTGSETATDKNRIQYKHLVDLAMQAGVAGKFCTTSGFSEAPAGASMDSGMRNWCAERRGWFDQFDAASFHCYGWQTGSPPPNAGYDRLENLPNDYRGVQSSGGFKWPGGLWITEHGITSGSNPDIDDKSYLIRSYALGLSQRGVRKMFWFRGGYDPNHRDMLTNSSVRTAVFYGYKTLTSFWGNALSVERWASGNAQGAIATMVDGSRCAIAWKHDFPGASSTVGKLGLPIKALFDQDGATISASTALTARPVFATLVP